MRAISRAMAPISRAVTQQPSKMMTPLYAAVKSASPKAIQYRHMSGAAKPEEDKAAASETPPKEEEAAAAAEEAEPEELSVEAQLQAKLDELQGSHEEMENRWKRALADSENTRGQAKREIANAKKFAVQGFAKSMVDVLDTLGLAIEHTPEEEKKGTLFEGVEMTEKILLQQMEKHGVTKFNPVDEVFDPNVHMALFEMPVEGKEPGTIAQVLKVGYMLNDRVLRPADVGVVKKVA